MHHFTIMFSQTTVQVGVSLKDYLHSFEKAFSINIDKSGNTGNIVQNCIGVGDAIVIHTLLSLAQGIPLSDGMGLERLFFLLTSTASLLHQCAYNWSAHDVSCGKSDVVAGEYCRQADGCNRTQSNCYEVGLYAKGCSAQQFRDDVPHLLFLLVTRHYNFFGFQCRLWQCLVIGLAVRSQWDCLKPHIDIWYHIFCQ